MRIPKLSIIIPVYNAGLYLDACVESILLQEFGDFEIILVNDGSTDDSSIICDKYAQIDSRIRVFHKKNGGVSSARNLGLEHAIGEWVYFVDADDSLAPDCLKRLMVVSDDIDVVQFGYNKIENDVITLKSKPSSINKFKSVDDFYSHSDYKTFTLWSHLIRLSLIKRFEIKFTLGVKYGEDLEFVIKALLVSNVIFMNPICCYNYYIREGSAMRAKRSYSQALNHLTVASRIIDFSLINKSVSTIFIKSRVTYMIKSFFSYTASIPSYDLDLKSVKNDYSVFFDKYYKLDYINLFILKVARFYPNLYIMALRRIIKYYNGK